MTTTECRFLESLQWELPRMQESLRTFAVAAVRREAELQHAEAGALARRKALDVDALRRRLDNALVRIGGVFQIVEKYGAVDIALPEDDVWLLLALIEGDLQFLENFAPKSYV